MLAVTRENQEVVYAKRFWFIVLLSIADEEVEAVREWDQDYRVSVRQRYALCVIKWDLKSENRMKTYDECIHVM